LEAFPKISFDIVGEPKDLEGARVLAVQDKYEFQKWALSMISAQPYKGGKKGGGGVDGFLYIKPALYKTRRQEDRKGHRFGQGRPKPRSGNGQRPHRDG
jgi:hypothetical protein